MLFSALSKGKFVFARSALQKQDLELQRNEIILTRTELKKSAKAQQNSKKALIEQVEQMKVASKLNALKTLIDYYNLQIVNPNNFCQKKRNKTKENFRTHRKCK